MLPEFNEQIFPQEWAHDAELRAKPFWDQLISSISFGDRNGPVRFENGAVVLSSTADAGELKSSATGLLPWRKGPWRIGDLHLDCEWRSDWKWSRIAPHLDLRGKRVADVGCGNGYYMFRALEQNPLEILGLEPMLRFRLQFEWMKSHCDDQRLHMLPLGIEHLDAMKERFDVVLCMGVLYHRPDHMLALSRLYQSLKPEGMLILEGITLPQGSTPEVLVPTGRYARMRNVFTIPTPNVLKTWIEQAGFRDVDIVSDEATTMEEQRGTEWMPYHSLEKFLDPQDPAKTIEGYPAPRRTVLIATR